MTEAQSRAIKKYSEKEGLISKSYKLKREIVEAFAESCRSAGVSQASQLTNLMNEYVSKQSGK